MSNTTNRSKTEIPSAGQSLKGGKTLDQHFGRVYRRVIAMIPIGFATGLSVSSLHNMAEFTSAGDYLGTAALIIAFFVLGISLWRSKRAPSPLSSPARD